MKRIHLIAPAALLLTGIGILVWTLAGLPPVLRIAWLQAKSCCAWLSRRSGLPVRLPSEAEWECACRAGSRGKFCFGDEEEMLIEYASPFFWLREGGTEVGTRHADAWGLHDLHGKPRERQRPVGRHPGSCRPRWQFQLNA